MSFSFDQSDDAAVWRWNCRQARSTCETSLHVEEALNWLGEIIDSETVDSSSKNSGFRDQADLSIRMSRMVNEAHDLSEQDKDFCRHGDSLLVSAESFLLQQIATLQNAVSSAVVTCQFEQRTSDLEWIGDSVVESDQSDTRTGESVQISCFQNTVENLEVLSNVLLCQVDPVQQQGSLNEKLAPEARRHSRPSRMDVKADVSKRGSNQEEALLFPAALDMKVNTICVAFDLNEFVKVGSSVTAANKTAAVSIVGGGPVQTDAKQQTGGKYMSSPVMQRRKETMWGPHWTPDTRAEQNH